MFLDPGWSFASIEAFLVLVSGKEGAETSHATRLNRIDGILLKRVNGSWRTASGTRAKAID
jgi:hypothetical protein